MTARVTSPYVTLDKYGRKEMAFEKFCRALADALGYPISVDSPGSYSPGISFDAGDGLTIIPRAGYGARIGRVEMWANCAGAAKLEQHERAKVESISVDTSRPLDAIAKDVKRRLVEPGRVAAEATREAVAKRAAVVGGLKALAASLMAEFPGLSINHRDNETRADVYFNRDGVYLTGSIDADGRVNVQRLSISTPDQARSLFALVAGRVN